VTESADLRGVPLVCAECGREAGDDENAADGWRAYSDGVGDLHTFCPKCAAREFDFDG
jgi:hypothetical protein